MDLLLKGMAREEPLLLIALSDTETVEKARVKTGEIATDLAYYLSASEQTPAAVSLGVHVERDNKVKASGGLYFAFVFGAGFILESLCVLWLTYEGIMHGP